MEVYQADGTLLTSEYTTANSLGWLTDGKMSSINIKITL